MKIIKIVECIVIYIFVARKRDMVEKKEAKHFMQMIALLVNNTVSDSVLLLLTLKVLVTTIDAQWEGMGDVGLARYEPALLPPCPTIRVFKLQ